MMGEKKTPATEHVAGKSRRRQSTHFFKLMLKSSINDKRLGIPKKFVEQFGDELSDIVATLIVPNGRVWKIGLTKSDQDVWFDENWQEFVEYYSIGFGSFLLFRYEGESNFHVFIFDINTCEINYPCHITSAEEQSNHNEQSLPLCDLDLDGVVEVHNNVDSQVNRIVDECEGEERACPEHGKRAASEDRDNLCTKKSKIDDQVETGPSNSPRPSLSNDAENVDATNSLEKDATNSYKAKKTMKIDERVLLGKDVEELKKYGRKRFSFKSLSLRRPVTDEEKDEALQRARRFRSDNPNFLVTLRNHHKYNAHVNVPSDFSHNYMSNVSGSIKLEIANGRRWDVRCYPISEKNRALIMTKGWNVFYKDNFLEEGDVCVFELVQRDDVVLKVTIFRVVET